jgi:putative ABC transport system permease protein
VDSTFFDLFTYHFTNGNALNVLSEPYSVVLLKSVSDKLFGSEEPIGKFIRIDNDYGRHLFKVTGVVDESLGKSHIHANLFFTMNSGGIGDSIRNSNSWAGNNMAASYIKLYPHTNVAALQNRLPAFLNKYGQEQLKSLGMEKRLELQPVRTIHTSTQYEGGMDKPVSPSFLYTLLLIAALIQVIACINFMNLSTARASKRAKEVGVRKVIGAGRRDLVKQFLSESFLLSLLGVLVALPLLQMVLPVLNEVTQSNVQLSLASYQLWLVLGGLVIITGLVAGSYPAFYLSAFQAIKVIKGNFANQISAAGIRRSLVVFQFVLSIVLITGIIVIYSQLNYINNKDLGFEKEQRLIFSFYTADTKSRMSAFANDLRQLSEVTAVSKASNYPSHYVFSDFGVYLAGGNMAMAPDAQNMTTDEYFVKAMGIRLISGRDFRLHDSSKVLINETLAGRLGIKPEAAPGTRLYSQRDDLDRTPVTYEIVGVMKDFNYNSLRTEVMPFLLKYHTVHDDGMSDLLVSTSSKDYKALLAKMQAIWHRDLAATPFECSFLDEEVQKQYETESTLGKIINSFTLMAIIISCLGLFGLTAFSAEQRSKEIGIRKVLGASVSGIVQLLSKDFLTLVLIAIVIATPIAWWAMNKWLDAFVYRVPIRWWMFAVAGLLAILIALVTVSFQAIRAALVNPVRSLKAE